MPLPVAGRHGYRGRMRALGKHDCGQLLDLESLRHRFHLGRPVAEGTETIAVARIIGSVTRVRDFDGCWHPRHKSLAKRIDDIAAADPSSLDEPIEVVRVDRAYFVADGHKRIALARRQKREFIDARVRGIRSPYEISSDAKEQVILRTAREGEFRRHSGIAESVPGARFALTDIGAYGELFRAFEVHALELSQREEQLVPTAQAAADWYEADYLPTVEAARDRIQDLLDLCTDADAYLALYRQRVADWGTECDAPSCAADQLRARRRLAGLRRASIRRVVGRSDPRQPTELLLPLVRRDSD